MRDFLALQKNGSTIMESHSSDGCDFYEFAVFFVNRWLRDRVSFAKRVLKGSGVMICELLSKSVLELYNHIKKPGADFRRQIAV
nr:unnamed protein product [Callosobruchus analis]